MDDLLNEFLTETAEALAALDLELVSLEKNSNDPVLIGSIFRLMHTIKGTCGFLDLKRLETLAHSAENVLVRFRDGELEVTQSAVTLILQTLDRLKVILAALEQTQKEPDGDDADLISQLDRTAEGTLDETAPVAAPKHAADEDATAPEISDTVDADSGPSLEELDALFASTPAAPIEAEPAVAAARPPIEMHDAASAATQAPPGELSAAGQSIRVGLNVLEGLMTRVSELVLLRNQLLQMVRKQDDSPFAAPLQQLSHVTSELQEVIMKTRMQPIGNAWQKLPRIVRDLSRELGKDVELEMVGADTELDRQVLEAVKDPLTHMVRNAVDHGLETPVNRAAAGKQRTGRIRLEAFHEGGYVIVRIGDDGRGLSLAKIREKVVRKGLADAVAVDAMPDSEVQRFIFEAGFSTAEAVTNVSGRGVGMDVVRSNIEKIGGTIEMSSVEGAGTDFTIKIPLTLAIVSALIVETAGQRFAIPQISVCELVRISANGEHRIETLDSMPLLRLRNQLLPLVSLRGILCLNVSEEASPEAFVVVTRVGTYSFGIMVERVFDAEEIVVKPVASMLRGNPIFSGNTILGDGSIVLILDPNGIAMGRAGVGSGEGFSNDVVGTEAAPIIDRVPLLLFRAGGTTPKAVPLALVARLEEIAATQIEGSREHPVVQYRGGLMPLIRIDANQELAPERQPIIVFSDRDRALGIVVDEILDIVDDRLDLKLPTAERPGLMGTAIIAGRVTDIVDTGFFLTQTFPDWFGDRCDAADIESAQRKILMVDDSAFFRNLLAPLLQAAGYAVTSADHAHKAMNLLRAGHRFDVIISDIEMPDMDGFAFAQAVRETESLQDVPLIALSTKASPADIGRGKSVGFTDYVPKFDRDRLLDTLSETLNVRGAA